MVPASYRLGPVLLGDLIDDKKEFTLAELPEWKPCLEFGHPPCLSVWSGKLMFAGVTVLRWQE